jgi:adenylate cyclase
MQRKLTAILSADVVGYSGMMEADEAGTLERLKANRARIFDPHVNIHGGRVFKLMGDGALAEFSSVIAAVNCALAIQEATQKAGGEDARPIRYRIGINMGEVILEGDDIYGEGVNVAARIQALAPVGGVAISRSCAIRWPARRPARSTTWASTRSRTSKRPCMCFPCAQRKPRRLRKSPTNRASCRSACCPSPI